MMGLRVHMAGSATNMRARPPACTAAPAPAFTSINVIALCDGGADHRSNMQWISGEDHRWKTFVNVR
jgi:hypothetical protein